MYMSRIEPEIVLPSVEAADDAGVRGSLAVGILALAVAIPYGAARLIGGLLWRDIVRAVHFARLCGGAYGDALKRR